MSPLEDTYFAIRPIIPTFPFEIPNSIRPLNPMMPLGDGSMFNNTDPSGNPTTSPILNQLVNFGWEYMLHCHILSHEEMDMMRPVVVAMPPNAPDGLTFSFVGTEEQAADRRDLQRQLDQRDRVPGATHDKRHHLGRCGDGSAGPDRGEYPRRCQLYRPHRQR